MFIVLHSIAYIVLVFCCFFFFQAEDGIRDLVRSRGLGDVYKRQTLYSLTLLLSEMVLDICITNFTSVITAPGGIKSFTPKEIIPLLIWTPAVAVSYTHLTLPTIYSV